MIILGSIVLKILNKLKIIKLNFIEKSFKLQYNFHENCKGSDMENLYCSLEDLITESDVEQKFIYKIRW